MESRGSLFAIFIFYCLRLFKIPLIFEQIHSLLTLTRVGKREGIGEKAKQSSLNRKRKKIIEAIGKEESGGNGGM